MTGVFIKIMAVFAGWVVALILSAAAVRRIHLGVACIVLAGVLATVYSYSRHHLVSYRANEEDRCALLTGDEPDYLLTALSIARDGDIDVSNNIEQEDYRQFQNRPVGGGDFDFFNRISGGRLAEHRVEWGSRRYMQHRPGISAVVAPVFLLAQGHYRWWAYALISSILVLFAVVSWLLAGRLGVDRGLAWLATMGCMLAPPVLFYANQVYPEVVAGCLLALAASVLMVGGRTVGLAVAMLVAVVWFSERALPACAVLAVVTIVVLRSWWSRAAAAAAFLGVATLFGLYCQHRFGMPVPISHNEVFGCSVALIPRRMIQILFDALQGWVWLFPPVLLLPAILWSLARERPLPLVPLVIAGAILLSLAMVASFGDWQGGTNPRGRYYVIPQLLALPLLFHWFRAGDVKIRKMRVGWFIGLTALALIPLPWLLRCPSWWYRPYHPFFAWEPIQWLYEYLPSLADDAVWRDWLKWLAWLPFLMVPSISCIWRGRNVNRSREVRKGDGFPPEAVKK